MKLVREHINEKFAEDSDPIRDLNIGRLSEIKEKYSDYTLASEHEEIGNAFQSNPEDLFYLGDNTYDEDEDKNDPETYYHKIQRDVESAIHDDKTKLIYDETWEGRNRFKTYVKIYDTPKGKIGKITYSYGDLAVYMGDVSAFVNIVEKYIKKLFNEIS